MTQAIDIKSRRRSLLAERGDEARESAQRELLRETLIAKGWHLTRTAEALGMPGPSQVLRAIASLGLRSEYEHARGWVKVAV